VASAANTIAISRAAGGDSRPVAAPGDAIVRARVSPDASHIADAPTAGNTSSPWNQTDQATSGWHGWHQEEVWLVCTVGRSVAVLEDHTIRPNVAVSDRCFSTKAFRAGPRGLRCEQEQQHERGPNAIRAIDSGSIVESESDVGGRSRLPKTSSATGQGRGRQSDSVQQPACGYDIGRPSCWPPGRSRGRRS